VSLGGKDGCGHLIELSSALGDHFGEFGHRDGGLPILQRICEHIETPRFTGSSDRS